VTGALDPVIELLRGIDPTDLAAAISVLHVDDPHREAVALGLALADYQRIRLQGLRDIAYAIHSAGTTEQWRALANRDRREAVLARRNVPLTPAYCQAPGCSARGSGKPAVLYLEHPLPPLDEVLCPTCAMKTETERAA
jgi:hypothetical protein